MAVVVAPTSTLATIIQKVRRLTRSPSIQQITDQEIADYVNTFIIYDFPDHLKLFDFRTTLTWYCSPYKDVYETNTTVLPITDPLYNFQNNYISVHPPIFIAGKESLYSQDREQFFGIYPKVAAIQSIGTTGDGVTTNFLGTLSATPILPGQVLFDSISATNGGISLVDIPSNPFNGTGTMVLPGTTAPQGTINYVTGVFNITFTVAPGNGQPINSQTVPYQPAMPQALLYYDNKFTIRPVPDQPYAINMEVYKRPTAILNTDNLPQLNDFWQYISYGAAKKILEDRTDMETLQIIMPEFKTQERLVLRKTIQQVTNSRAATIYTEQSGLGGGFNYPGGYF